MQFYGISFMHSYKQSGRWQDVFDEKNTIKLHVQLFLKITLGCSKNVDDTTIKLKH